MAVVVQVPFNVRGWCLASVLLYVFASICRENVGQWTHAHSFQKQITISHANTRSQFTLSELRFLTHEVHPAQQQHFSCPTLPALCINSYKFNTRLYRRMWMYSHIHTSQKIKDEVPGATQVISMTHVQSAQRCCWTHVIQHVRHTRWLSSSWTLHVHKLGFSDSGEGKKIRSCREETKRYALFGAPRS